MAATKTAIITGASRGIGLATAHKLAAEGMNLTICSRNQQAIEQAATELRSQYDTDILAITANVSVETDAEKLFSETYKKFNRIDICVNNAGALALKAFTEMTDAEFWSIFNSNFKSTYLCCKQAFHYMQQNNDTSFIVNVSSLSGIRFVEKFPNMSAYIAAKHAVVGLTESLAVEGKPHHIQVNCVAPGAVDTKMFNDHFSDFNAGSTPEEIARVIALFCDEKQLGSVNGNIFEIFCNE